MSALVADLRAMGHGLINRFAIGVARLRRVTAAVALLRLLIASCVLGASALALPAEYVLSRTVVVPLVLAVAVALFPRTSAVSVALLVVAGIWLVSTPDPPLWKVLPLAALLYVGHAAAAFAAVIPYDCAVAPGALLRWAARTGSVVVASLAVGAAGMALTGAVALPTSVLGPIVGSLVAVGIVALIVWQLRRRPSR